MVRADLPTPARRGQRSVPTCKTLELSCTRHACGPWLWGGRACVPSVTTRRAPSARWMSLRWGMRCGARRTVRAAAWAGEGGGAKRPLRVLGMALAASEQLDATRARARAHAIACTVQAWPCDLCQLVRGRTMGRANIETRAGARAARERKRDRNTYHHRRRRRACTRGGTGPAWGCECGCRRRRGRRKWEGRGRTLDMVCGRGGLGD